MKQSPCACVNATLPCASNSSKVAPTVAEVDVVGNPLQIDHMFEGQWYNSSILNTVDTKYVKFQVPYDPLRPCPIIQFEFQNQVGTLGAFISARMLPTNGAYDFAHQFYAHSWINICPSQPSFYYGTYYVYIINQTGRSMNMYGMRYTITNSPTCLAPPAVNVTALPSASGSTWLQDGVITPIAPTGASTPAYQYYQLYVDGRCSNFSTAIYRTASWQASVFMYVSPNTNLVPSELTITSVPWYIRIIDSYINVQYCNPDPTATYNIYYIGLRTASASGNYQLVATAQQYTPSLPISTLAYSQYRLDMAYTAAPEIKCATAQYSCRYFPYRGCDSQGIGCCLTYTPIPPEEHVQAMWPWNAGDTSVGQFHWGINWDDMQPLKVGKMAWSLWLEWRDANSHYIQTAVDPGTCNVTLGAGFVNSRGDPLSLHSISFTPKVSTCDYAEYLSVIARVEQLRSEYLQLKDNVNDLALNQLRIVIASWNDVYDACKDEVTTSYAALAPTYTYDNATVCNHLPYTAAWVADPCCYPFLRPTESCRPSSVSRVLYPVSGTVNKANIQSTCANPECSASSVQTLLDTSNHIADLSTGCQQALTNRASVQRSLDLLSFTYQCKQLVEGADLLSARCTSSAQCWNGAACMPTTGRCNHTVDDVLNCMATKVDQSTALGLFSAWGITGEPTPSGLFDAFKAHWVRTQCTGPNAPEYREGFHYGIMAPGCVDDCLLDNLEPFCVDASLSRTSACLINSMCDHSVNSSSAVCFRNWKPVSEDPLGCTTRNGICNWRSNTTYPCPHGADSSTLATCEANCLNGSTYACLDCSNDIAGTCLEVDWITDSVRCGLGMCTTNSSVTDPTACALDGVCSAPCPGCTQSECVSTGSCSDYSDFKSLVDGGYTGVCLRPRNYNSVSYTCASGWSTNSWACASMTSGSIVSQASCASAAPGAFWYTFANSSSNCTTNAGYGCYSKTSNFFWDRNQTECALCGDCMWRPHYSWSQGTWTPGRTQELTWQQRQYYIPSSLNPAVDYTLVTKDVNAAITRDFAYAYYTDSLCRYDSLNNLVKTVVCDCNTSDKTGCFQNQNAAAIGSARACPYQAQTLQTSVAIVQLDSQAVPTDGGCKEVDIAATSVGKYQVPPDHSVTHALFDKIQQNPYLIVVNAKKAVVGQLVSDAATVTINFTPLTSLSLCILVDEFIQVDKAATLYTLAQVQLDQSIEIFSGGTPQTLQQLAAYAASVNSSRLQVCGTTTVSGTYFAVAVVPNYQKLDPSPSAETIAASVLYFSLAALALVQVLLLLLDHRRQNLLAFKFIALGIVCVNVAVRTAYMLVGSTAFKNGMESIAFIIFELPTFLYFSVFTVIVYLWVLVVLNTHAFGKKRGQGSRRKLARTAFILLNVFMYSVFVVFIYLIAILPAATKLSPCFLGNLDSAITSVERTIKIAYWIFQLVVSILLAVGFLISLIFLLRILVSLKKRDLGNKGKSSDKTDTQMIIITVVALVCVVFLLVRSAIFLDVAVNTTTLHVIVFCLLEIIPQAMLVFYLHPFRCFREAGRQSTTGGSSKGSRGTHSGSRPYSTTTSATRYHHSSDAEMDSKR